MTTITFKYTIAFIKAMRMKNKSFIPNFKTNRELKSVTSRGLLISALLFLSMGFATCDPPNGGYDQDWNILITDNCFNSSGDSAAQINITGNVIAVGNLTLSDVTLWVNKSITITGNISLSNVTIRMNSTTDGADIDVQANGNFTITNSSYITNGDTAAAEYDFYFRDGSYGSINDTAVSELFTDSNGISIADSSGNVVIENSTVYDSEGYGINLASGSSGIRIYNVTINNSVDDCIYMTDSTNNEIIYSRIGNSSGNNGIYLDGASNLNQIVNNTISGHAVTGVTIRSTSHNNTVQNNNISQNTWGGIWITDSSGGNNITWNNISDNPAEGIFIDTTANYNNIINNTISNNTNSNIYMEDVATTWIYGNNITNSTIWGIYLNQTSSATIDSNSIQNNTIGLHLAWYSSYSDIVNILNNNTLTNNNITIAFNNTNCTVYNVTLPTAVNWNATLSHNSQVTFENVTFTKTAVNVSDTSLLNVTWYADTVVLDGSTYLPLFQATVNIYDTNGVLRYTDLTDASGTVTTQILNEYEEDNTGKTYFRNYDFNSTASGYSAQSNSTALANSQTVYLQMNIISGEGGGGGGTQPPDDEEENEFKTCMEINNISSETEDKDENGIPDCIEICGVYNSPKAGGGGGGMSNPAYHMEGIQIIPDKLYWENVESGTLAEPIKVTVIFKGEHTIDFKSDTFWAVLPTGVTFTDSVELMFNADASWLQGGEYFDVIEVYCDGVLCAELPMGIGVDGGINIWWKLGISKEIGFGLLFLILIAILYEIRRRMKKR